MSVLARLDLIEKRLEGMNQTEDGRWESICRRLEDLEGIVGNSGPKAPGMTAEPYHPAASGVLGLSPQFGANLGPFSAAATSEAVARALDHLERSQDRIVTLLERLVYDGNTRASGSNAAGSDLTTGAGKEKKSGKGMSTE